MNVVKIEDTVIDFLLRKNPYALVMTGWLDYDKNGYKACYQNADCEQTDVWLSTHNKDEAIQIMQCYN